jgi:hypothetical protein
VLRVAQTAEWVMDELQQPQGRWRHKKRGTTYRTFGVGTLQSGHAIEEGTTLIAYQGEDGRVWFRPLTEFTDGRFEKVDP